MEKIYNTSASSNLPPSEGFREAYLLHLADSNLILGHRNSEWCGHAPVLEQDIAITNISLDLIGQARNFYQYAASLLSPSEGGASQGAGEVTEDVLAYLRPEREFKNCLLAEQPNGDWGQTVLRQFLFSTWEYFLYEQLKYSKDEQLAAIAGKSLKEVTYHLRWSSEWVIRLGDGTAESHTRMLRAIDELWRYTEDLFSETGYELKAASEGIAVDSSLLKQKWEKKVKDIFLEATLPVPAPSSIGGSLMGAGKDGIHTEHLGHILAELQYMQRAYPGCAW